MEGLRLRSNAERAAKLESQPSVTRKRFFFVCLVVGDHNRSIDATFGSALDATAVVENFFSFLSKLMPCTQLFISFKPYRGFLCCFFLHIIARSCGCSLRFSLLLQARRRIFTTAGSLRWREPFIWSELFRRWFYRAVSLVVTP